MLLIPVGFAQAVFTMTLSGDPEPIVNTVGFKVLNPPWTQADTEALDAAWKVTPGLRAEVSSSYQFTKTTVYVGQDGGPPVVFESTNAPSAGLGAGAPLPQNCAVLATKRTALAGRRNKGRWYIPGIGEGAVDALGVIAGATVTAFQTAMNATFTNLRSVTNVEQLYILHNSEGVTAPGPPSEIISWAIQPKIATQRRRLRP